MTNDLSGLVRFWSINSRGDRRAAAKEPFFFLYTFPLGIYDTHDIRIYHSPRLTGIPSSVRDKQEIHGRESYIYMYIYYTQYIHWQLWNVIKPEAETPPTGVVCGGVPMYVCVCDRGRVPLAKLQHSSLYTLNNMHIYSCVCVCVCRRINV